MFNVQNHSKQARDSTFSSECNFFLLSSHANLPSGLHGSTGQPLQPSFRLIGCREIGTEVLVRNGQNEIFRVTEGKNLPSTTLEIINNTENF